MDYSRRAVLALLAGGPVLMAVKPDNPVVGGTSLARARINSPNFVTGVSGWTINQDGSAEFNNLTIRGTFKGTNFIINSTGLFFYSPTEALGNLIVSISNGGTGPFGEAVSSGVIAYGGSGQRLALLGAELSFDGGGFISEAGSSPFAITIGGAPVNILTAISSVLAAVHPGTASTPETWQSVTPGGTWTASGSGVNGFFYRLLPDGNVALAWDVSNNNANPGTLGTLPAGYRPATTVRLASGWTGTGPAAYNNAFSPMIQVASSGAITGGGLFVATLTLFGTAILPLGSL